MFKKESKSFYKLPFKEARAFLPTIYLDLSFIKQLEVDVKTFDLKVIYTNTSIMPTVIINNQNGNPYLKLMPPEAEIKNSNVLVSSNLLHLGYKHFDKCKLKNGLELGDLRTNLDQEYLASKRIKSTIQKHVLGWKYWLYKFKGDLK